MTIAAQASRERKAQNNKIRKQAVEIARWNTDDENNFIKQLDDHLSEAEFEQNFKDRVSNINYDRLLPSKIMKIMEARIEHGLKNGIRKTYEEYEKMFWTVISILKAKAYDILY